MADNEQQHYRFSESPIWELQRSYFEERGIEAWQSEEVPQYITSNPGIAMAYAEMIFGFLQDRAGQGHLTEPVAILELGAGSGKLAFHVLTELCALSDFAGIQLPPFRYIMSDLPDKNIAYWQRHSSLLPFVQQGLLDFARFDAVLDAELHLTESKLVISPGDLRQPLLVIANYFFDSIPQELIYVDEGKILECRVSMQFPEEAADLTAAQLLEKVVPEYHYRRAAQYEEDSYPYHEVIALYRHKLEDSHILFPVTGLNCLERLHRLSRAGFVLLTADKGDHRMENWEFAGPPKLIHHGSFSLTANYHAIKHVFEHKGAQSHFTTHHYSNLNIGCILMLQEPNSYAHTRLAYRRFVERFGPDDYFSLMEGFHLHLDELELRPILSFWRLGGYDAQLFLQYVKRIMELLPASGDEEMLDIQQGIERMWASYYFLEEKQDLALECGLLLFEMEQYEEAWAYFKRSSNDHKADPAVLYNMAVCCYELGMKEASLEYTRGALAREPEQEGALGLLEVLRENWE